MKRKEYKNSNGCAVYNLIKTGGKIALKSASSLSEISAVDQLCFGNIIPIKHFTQKLQPLISRYLGILSFYCNYLLSGT